MNYKKQDRAIWFVLAYAFLICGVGVALARMVNPGSAGRADPFFDYKYRFGQINKQCMCSEEEPQSEACCSTPLDISCTQVPMLRVGSQNLFPYACFYAKFKDKEVVLCQPQPRVNGHNATITLQCVRACDALETQKRTCSYKLIGNLSDGTPCYLVERP